MCTHTHTLLQYAVRVAQSIINVGHIAKSKRDRVCVLRIGRNRQALGIPFDKLERVLDQVACMLGANESHAQLKNEVASAVKII
jgi:hypothetical protein